MAIRKSRAADLGRLIEELGSPDAVTRESAAARLAIRGRAATPRLIALAERRDAGVPARTAALRVLAATAGPSVLDLAVRTLRAPEDELAVEAVEICRVLAAGPEPHATRAFEPLTELALETTASVERRLAAIGALEGLPDALLRPVYEALVQDITASGDTAALGALARAWVASKREDRWWRDHVASAFRAIVAREGLTREHASLQQVLSRWPAAGVLVASAPRSTAKKATDRSRRRRSRQ